MTRPFNRNRTVDLLKGLCVLFVILSHSSFSSLERRWLLFPFWVDMAVPLFMILSGYVYFASYEREGVRSLLETYAPRRIARRALRYVVPFLAVFILELLASFVYIRWSGEPVDWLAQPVRALLTGGAPGAGSYYTPIMIQFIFLFPLVYALIKRANTLGLLVCGVVNLVYEILQSAFGMSLSCYRLLLFRYLLLIAFGAYLYQNREKRLSPALGWTSLALGAAYIVANQYFGISFSFFPHWQGTCMLAALFALPVAAVLLRAEWKFAPLELVGRASYHIYLTQMVFFIFAAGRVSALVANRALVLALSIVLSLGCGLVFYYVERPVGRAIARAVDAYLSRYEADRWCARLDAAVLRDEATKNKS